MSEGRLILKPGEVLSSEKKPSGHILMDGNVIADTKQCGHCHKHVLSVRGSGITRGYCMKCNSWLCGAPECVSYCYPFEKRMEDFEKGKTEVLR